MCIKASIPSIGTGATAGRRAASPPEQLVVCAQNHDQIGNRAQGERLSMLIGVPQLKAVAALTLLSPFVPLVFQGEEWGATTPFLYFTDHQDPALGRLVAEGRAKEFGSFRWAGEVPNPQELRTFERSKLDWSEMAEASHADLLDWHRRLIELRSRKTRPRPQPQGASEIRCRRPLAAVSARRRIGALQLRRRAAARAAAGRRLGLGIELGAGRGCGTLASSRQWNPDLYAACGGRGGLIFVYAAGALSAAGVL